MLPLLPAIAAGSFILDRLGSLFRTGAAVAEEARKNVPVLEDEVVVEVVGQPGASKQELYFLALAAANGVVRRFQPLVQPNPLLPPTAAVIMIEYDAADHWVRATIRYQVGATAANVLTSSNAQRTAGKFIDNLAVYRGPQCEVVGGEFDFIATGVAGAVITGLPNAAEAPKLPFAGQVILTACPTTKKPNPAPIQNATPPTETITSPGEPIPSPNPKPPGDNRSRGAVVVSDGMTASLTTSGSTSTPPTSPGSPSASHCCPKNLNLVQLVFAALTDPGSFAEEVWVAPEQGPTGG